MKPTTLILLLATLLTSCMAEREEQAVKPIETQATFVVSALAPTRPATRAIAEGEVDDNHIREITALLFHPTTLKYEYKTQAMGVQPVGGVGNERFWTFQIRFPKGNFRVLFLANAAEMVDGCGPLSNLSMDDVEQLLRRTLAGKYNAYPATSPYQPFVMASDRLAITIPDNTDYTLHPIRLSRDVAKINLKFKTQALSDRLVLREIHLCNYNTLCYATPTRGWWSYNGNPAAALLAGDAARPAGAITTGANGIVYSGPDISGNQCVDQIFTPERPSGGDELCLLVRGDVDFNGATHADRWYKIELRTSDNGALKNVNILRNYAYTIAISGIDHPGYGSAQEAYDHNAEGIVTQIEATPEEGMNDIVYNGQYHLAVDRSALQLARGAGASQSLRVFTDYSGGWYVAGVDYGAGQTKWFEVSPQSYSPHITVPVSVTTLSANPSSSPRTATIILAAGTLRKQITLTQGVTVLQHRSDNLPARVIPQPGGTYRIEARTNLQGWGVKVFRGKSDAGQALLTKPFGTSPTIDAVTPGTYSVQITVPANNEAAPRTLSFWLYADEVAYRIPFDTLVQQAMLTLPMTGFPAPPGVLGVTESGELTLRGSALYRGTLVERDSEFGPVHDEAVFVAYFRWGSLVAINSTSNATNPDALISNGDAFGFSDFDWVHPNYEYNGLKGARALYSLLYGKPSTQMWTTLPMNGTLANWSPTNTARATGDPCPYATINASGALAAGYHLPKGSAMMWNDIMPSDYRYPVDRVRLTNGVWVNGRRDRNLGANGWRMFLPFAGFRNINGEVSGRGYDGNFWSREFDISTSSGGYYYSSNEYGVGVGLNDNSMGFPIRCVK